MTSEQPRRRDWGSPAEAAGKTMLKGAEALMDAGAERMLHETPKVAKYLLKRIPGGPGLVLDAVEFAQAKDKGRKLAGMAGGALGGLGGAAMGGATGPGAVVGVPLGAIVGSTAGEHIGEEIYDDHADDVRRSLEKTKDWIKSRNEGIARRLMNDARRYTRPPQ
jgi:hypothetical protein